MKANSKGLEAQEIYKVLVEKCTDGICTIQSGHFRFTNPEFQRIFGYAHGECIDRDIGDLVVPEDTELLTQMIKRIEAGTEKVNLRP